ncbi:MAG TPA: YbdK family carboxylate-amine ligase [Pirellulaceae bacterium]|nr:YbdK family carboxylate-amine ligase [Pirellulaceae bacterium]
MKKIPFTSNASPTLGVELEVGLIDLETLGLASYYDRLVQHLPNDDDCFKQEVMQCYVEVISCVCRTVGDIDIDISRKLQRLRDGAQAAGMGLWMGATHPFSMWQDQEITNNPRYHNLVDLLQEFARRMITFGLHVHVGVDSGDKAVMFCDRILEYLPLLLAISTSSPFWESRRTGLKSHRSKIMEGLPTAGLPPVMRNWSEYVWLVNHMIETGFINTIREIWWDVRPHHGFGTVEVRVCDMPSDFRDVLAITALIQCLVQDLSNLIDEGTYQTGTHPILVQQNKWRAARFGNQAMLIDMKTYQSVPVVEVLNQLVDRLTPVAKSLDCLPYLERVRELGSGPTSADRQLSIYDAHGNSTEIVRQMALQL